MTNLKLANLERRAAMLHLIRGFFGGHGYLEVETPLRIPAPLPEAHIEAVPSDGWVLQPSPEFCMKRLLASGCGRSSRSASALEKPSAAGGTCRR